LPSEPSRPTERRQSPRYRCQGGAEFRVGGTDVRTWGTLTDLSLHGCYIEMTATFPIGASVDLALELNGRRVQALGEVRVSYPFLGMGIAFHEVSPASKEALREMVRSLLPAARVASPEPAPEASRSSHKSLPVIVNPVAALQALVDFYETRSLLSKEELLQLIHKSQMAR
jgi:PilZ domain